MCGKSFTPYKSRKVQQYCGTYKKKTGCSYINYRSLLAKHKKNNPKIYKAYYKKYLKSEKGQRTRREYAYKRSYNISIEEYEDLLNKQGGICLICKKKEKQERKYTHKYNKELDVDHNHKTGKVRGLLCQKCNRGLGCFNDNPKLIKNAYNYLLRWN